MVVSSLLSVPGLVGSLVVGLLVGGAATFGWFRRQSDGPDIGRNVTEIYNNTVGAVEEESGTDDPQKMAQKLATLAQNGTLEHDENGLPPAVVDGLRRFADADSHNDYVAQFKRQLRADGDELSANEVTRTIEPIAERARAAFQLEHDLNVDHTNQLPEPNELRGGDVPLVARLEEPLRRLDELRSENDELHEQTRELEQQLDQRDAEIDRRVRDLEDELDEKREEIERLHGEIDEIEATNGQLRSELDDCEQRFQTLEAHVESVCDDVRLSFGDRSGIELAEKLAAHAANGKIDMPQGAIAAEQISEKGDPAADATAAKALLAGLDPDDESTQARPAIEQAITELNEAATIRKRIGSVDQSTVRANAEEVRSRASAIGGTTANAIEQEIDGRLLASIENANDDAPLYAAQRTVKHFDGMLDEVERHQTVDETVDELVTEVESLSDDVQFFVDNRAWNHEIPKYIHSEILEEAAYAESIAGEGRTDEAIGRLSTAVVALELLLDIYNQPRYSTVLEIAAQ